jgi:hypothetical protein
VLIHFIGYYRIDMDSTVETCGKAMIAATALYWLAALNLDLPYASAYFNWFNDVSLSASAERDYLDSPVLTLALGTAPFLYIPWCLIVVRLFRFRRGADFVWLLLYGAAIAMSGARGIVAVALAFMVAAAIWLTSPRTRTVLILALATTLTIGVPALLASTTLFSSEEISNAAKIGHFTSFVDSLDWSRAFLGSGLGSYYFSTGKSAITPHTELTPIDLARYFGIPLAIFFYGLVLLPFNHLGRYKGIHSLFALGFFLYLVLSVTNPVLINSYGMLVVLWYWAKLQPERLRVDR